MCTCVVTSGDTLSWSTTQPGVCSCCFQSPVVSFSSQDAVATARNITMAITAELTNNTVGQLTSILIFTPSAVSTTGLTVTCENTYEGKGKTLTVTYSGTTSAFRDYMYWGEGQVRAAGFLQSDNRRQKEIVCIVK